MGQSCNHSLVSASAEETERERERERERVREAKSVCMSNPRQGKISIYPTADALCDRKQAKFFATVLTQVCCAEHGGRVAYTLPKLEVSTPPLSTSEFVEFAPCTGTLMTNSAQGCFGVVKDFVVTSLIVCADSGLLFVVWWQGVRPQE